MTARLTRLSDVNLSKALAWLLTAIVVPGGAWAISSAINKIDSLVTQVQIQAIRQTEISGKVDRLELKLSTSEHQTTERNNDRREDVAEIKADVRDLAVQVQRLAIAVERLNFQRAADRAVQDRRNAP